MIHNGPDITERSDNIVPSRFDQFFGQYQSTLNIIFAFQHLLENGIVIFPLSE